MSLTYHLGKKFPLRKCEVKTPCKNTGFFPISEGVIFSYYKSSTQRKDVFL